MMSGLQILFTDVILRFCFLMCIARHIGLMFIDIIRLVMSHICLVLPYKT